MKAVFSTQQGVGGFDAQHEALVVDCAQHRVADLVQWSYGSPTACGSKIAFSPQFFVKQLD